MKQAAALAAKQAAVANEAANKLAKEAAPRAMHAEMVSVADVAAPRSVQVADKPRLFEIPIDRSKAEDPYKSANGALAGAPAGAPAPAASAAKPAYTPPPARVVPATPTARSAARMIDQAVTQEPSRQQREMQLATSGPRKASAKKPAVPVETAPPQYYENVRWGYAGLGAPENWAKLHPSYATCGIGKRQSPIDIRGGIKVDLDPVKFDYRPTQFRITDNGHTIQVDVAEGNTITLTGHRYQLQHLLFHRPAEVRVNGKAYDMAVHLVHKDYDNNRLIIAVLLEQGSEHPLIQTLWNHLPLEVGMDVAPPGLAIDLLNLLPTGRDYYTHMGSLTIPPCTENVTWVVFKDPLQVSPQQIGIFARLYPNNARPVQPLHDRLIKESR
jgi:carbonic anhydrase